MQFLVIIRIYYLRLIMKRFLFSLLFVITLSVHAEPKQLVLWHAMAGHLGDELGHLVDDFNKSQNDYVIKPVYKGNYIETLTSFAAAFRAHKAPAMVQVFEVGTAIMEGTPGAIKPVDVLMAEQNLSLPKSEFIPSVRDFYSRNGTLMAMPFNLSAPVIYYNADLLVRLGYKEANFPKTWDEMEILAKRVQKAGYRCTYTTAYPGWILFESYLAIHGMELRSPRTLKAAYDRPELVRHFQRLKRWHQLGYFRYGGRGDEATIFFTSGVCPLFSQSSGAYTSLAELVPFHLGVAAMPLDTKASKLRFANVVGGAALWAVGGLTPEAYRGVAQFFAFIAKPETQKKWHDHTGYLPIGVNGIYASVVSDSKQPVLAIVQKDLQGNGILKSLNYLGPQNQIRSINDEVIESLFSGLLSAKQAVHESVAQANHVFLRFERNTGTKQEYLARGQQL